VLIENFVNARTIYTQGDRFQTTKIGRSHSKMWLRIGKILKNSKIGQKYGK